MNLKPINLLSTLLLILIASISVNGQSKSDSTKLSDMMEKRNALGLQIDQSQNKDEIFTIVETNARFPEQLGTFQSWLQRNVSYPQEAKDLDIQGKVFFEFLVNKDGSISNIKILRGLGYGLDKEVLRLMSTCPNWAPAIQRGVNVRQRFVNSVGFKLM